MSKMIHTPTGENLRMRSLEEKKIIGRLKKRRLLDKKIKCPKSTVSFQSTYLSLAN